MPIKIDNLYFSYNSEMIIDDLNLKVNDNEILAIVGNTGSGKSTLVQLIAGVLKADKGKIIVDNDDITAKKFNKKILRKKLGIVFQFPEMQLFEQSVEKDIFFGLKQYNLSYSEKCARAKEVLELLGLDFEEIRDKSPLALSGGEKRKVAIAGVMVCKPKYLIFDEPIAGLDYLSRESFMKVLLKLKEQGTSIIIISHNLDYLAEYADRIIVMNNGKIVLDDLPNIVFGKQQMLDELNIGTCSSKNIINLLKANDIQMPDNIIKYNDLLNSLITCFGE